MVKLEELESRKAIAQSKADSLIRISLNVSHYGTTLPGLYIIQVAMEHLIALPFPYEKLPGFPLPSHCTTNKAYHYLGLV